MVSAGVILLAFGSPRGYPAVASVAEAMRDLGFTLTDLKIDPDQSWGVRRMVGTSSDGEPVEIKAFGRDAADSQFAARAWRMLVYRGEGGSLTFSRLQAAEHEALVTLLAHRAGVPVPEVLAAASTSGEVAILATRRRGARLDPADVEGLADPELVRLWQDVARLHDAGISHGALDVACRPPVTRADWSSQTSRRAPSTPMSARSGSTRHGCSSGWRSSWGSSEPSRRRAPALGDDRLGASLPYLQTPALSSRERRHPRSTARELKELRSRVVQETGVPVPEPVKLRRVGPRDAADAGRPAALRRQP